MSESAVEGTCEQDALHGDSERQGKREWLASNTTAGSEDAIGDLPSIEYGRGIAIKAVCYFPSQAKPEADTRAFIILALRRPCANFMSLILFFNDVSHRSQWYQTSSSLAHCDSSGRRDCNRPSAPDEYPQACAWASCCSWSMRYLVRELRYVLVDRTCRPAGGTIFSIPPPFRLYAAHLGIEKSTRRHLRPPKVA